MNIPSESLFRALSDRTRLRCLVLLVAERDLCVCEFTHGLDEAQPKVSRHLAQLREAGIVVDRRAGIWVHYRLNPGLPEWVLTILEAAAAGVRQEDPFKADAERLRNMPNRPGAQCCA